MSLMDIAQAAPFIAPAAVAIKMLYSMAMQAIANKKNCEKMAERLKAHERVLVRLGATKLSGQVAFLDTLVAHINKAVEFISSFSKKGWLRRVLSNSSDADTFAELQQDIDRTVSDIQFALQVEVFAAVTEAGPPAAAKFEDEGAAVREYVAAHGGMQAVMDDPELRKGLTDSLGVADQLVMGELEEIKAAIGELQRGVTDMHDDVRKLLELTTAATARPVRAALYGVPPLPPYFVDFTARVSGIVTALTPAEGAAPCAAIVYGFAGLGKSVFTAAAAVQADVVRRKYRDGILWLRVGQRADKLDVLMTAASSAHTALSTWNLGLQRCPALDGDVAPGITAVSVVTTYLTSLLQDRAMLLVLDDVWDADILTGIKALGISFVATTRSKALAEFAGATASTIPLDVLSEEDAVRMMTSILGLRALPGPAAVATLACAKGIPLTIALLSSMMKAKAPGRDASWNSALEKLQHGDSAATDTLHKAVQLSIDDLPRDARKRLRVLAFASSATPLPLPMLQPLLDLETEGDARDFAALLDDRCLARIVSITQEGSVRGMMLPDAVLDVLKEASSADDIAANVRRAAAWLSQLDTFAVFDEPSSRWLELSAQWSVLQAHVPALEVTASYSTALAETAASGSLNDTTVARAAARVVRFLLERDSPSAAKLFEVLRPAVSAVQATAHSGNDVARSLWLLASLCTRAYLATKADGAALEANDVSLVVHTLDTHAISDWVCADVAATAVAQLASRSRRPRGDDAADRLTAGGTIVALSPLLAAYGDNICIFRKVVTALDTLSRGAPSARTMAGAQITLPVVAASALVNMLRERRNDVHIIALVCNSLRTMMMGNVANQEVLLEANILLELVACLRAHEGSCIITQWITATLCALLKGSQKNQAALVTAGGTEALLHATRFWIDGMRSGGMTPAVPDPDGDLAISGCLAALAATCEGGTDARSAAAEGLPLAIGMLKDAQRGPAAISSMFTALPDLAGTSGLAAVDASALSDIAAYLNLLRVKLAARAAGASSAALPTAEGAAAAATPQPTRTPVNERLPEALVLIHAAEALAKLVAATGAASGALLRNVPDLPASLIQLQLYARESSRADIALSAVLACMRSD